VETKKAGEPGICTRGSPAGRSRTKKLEREGRGSRKLGVLTADGGKTQKEEPRKKRTGGTVEEHGRVARNNDHTGEGKGGRGSTGDLKLFGKWTLGEAGAGRDN